MIDCIAVGDSIAVGTGQAMHCTVRAHVGWSSSKIVTLSNGVKAELCIISAGSNDPKNPKLIVNLKKIRNNLDCNKVVWIKPINPTAANAVLAAKKGNDSVVSFTPSKDKVHPKSYSTLANSIKKVLAF
jgi:hypothetical protein